MQCVFALLFVLSLNEECSPQFSLNEGKAYACICKPIHGNTHMARRLARFSCVLFCVLFYTHIYFFFFFFWLFGLLETVRGHVVSWTYLAHGVAKVGPAQLFDLLTFIGSWHFIVTIFVTA